MAIHVITERSDWDSNSRNAETKDPLFLFLFLFFIRIMCALYIPPLCRKPACPNGDLFFIFYFSVFGVANGLVSSRQMLFAHILQGYAFFYLTLQPRKSHFLFPFFLVPACFYPTPKTRGYFLWLLRVDNSVPPIY